MLTIKTLNTKYTFMKSKILGFALLTGLLFSGSQAFSQSTKVVVYRKGCIYGAFAKYKVLVDHKQVATLGNNSIKTIDVAAGEHTIGPRQSKRAIKVDARNGEKTVVVYKTRFGIFGGRAHLKTMTVVQAKSKYKYFRNHADKMMM